MSKLRSKDPASAVIEKPLKRLPVFAEVPVPYTATGKISSMGQELYVRWLRSAGYDSVVLWGEIGRGGSMDIVEREELLSTWRGGLPPSTSMVMVVPFGGSAGSTQLALEQALAAREAGADKLIVQTGGDAGDTSGEAGDAGGELVMEVEQLGLPVYVVKESFGSTLSLETRAGERATSSGIASLVTREQFERVQPLLDKVLVGMPREVWPGLLLSGLVEQGVLAAEVANDVGDVGDVSGTGAGDEEWRGVVRRVMQL